MNLSYPEFNFANNYVIISHNRETMHGGTEWVIDAHDCAEEELTNLCSMQRICDQIVNDLRLTIVGEPQWHQFPEPSGVTGLYLLSESHLACHTFPEHRFATFNLYCCRPKPIWDWEANIREALGARSVEIRTLSRQAMAPTKRVDSNYRSGVVS